MRSANSGLVSARCSAIPTCWPVAREVRNDPNYGPILPNAVGSVKNRYRAAWEQTGGPIPPLKTACTAKTQPWQGVLGLRWADVDLEAGVIRIRQQLQRVGGALRTGPVKTRGGNRDRP
jgi:hypothetical protein